MNAFDVIGNPVRRRIVELLSERERSAGELAQVVGADFGISQPAVSNHLRVLREHGFVAGDREGSRRLYALRPGALDEVAAWVARYQRFWESRLDALETEVARGRSARRRATQDDADGAGTDVDTDMDGARASDDAG